MSTNLDLDDVVSGQPEAAKELDQLRAENASLKEAISLSEDSRLMDEYLKLERANARQAEQLAAAVTDANSKQARIDELMLEYCPDEMTPEQIEEWAKHQVPDDSAITAQVKDWKRGANAEAREVDAAHAKIAEQAAVISGYKADQQEQLQIQVEQAELITAIYNIVSEPALKKFGATAVIFDLIAAYKEQTK